MPLVNAKCTNCGAPLQVDNSHEAAVCPYCNSAYIVEKAIQNFNFSVTNNITAQNVIIAGKGEMEKERLLQNAQTNENFKEYDKALEIYAQVSEDYPDDYRGWFGMASMKTHKFKILDISDREFTQISSYIDKSMICAPDAQKSSIKSTWDQYLANHFAFLDKKKASAKDLKSKSEKLEEQIAQINEQINANKQKLELESDAKIISLYITLMVGGVGIMIISGMIKVFAVFIIGFALTMLVLLAYMIHKAIRGSKIAYIKANTSKINMLIAEDNVKIAKLNKENDSCKESIAFLKSRYKI